MSHLNGIYTLKSKNDPKVKSLKLIGAGNEGLSISFAIIMCN